MWERVVPAGVRLPLLPLSLELRATPYSAAFALKYDATMGTAMVGIVKTIVAAAAAAAAGLAAVAVEFVTPNATRAE